MPAQILLNWVGPGSSPKVSVLNVAPAPDYDSIITPLRAFLTAYAAWMDNGYGVSIVPEARVLNTVTGVLEAVVPIASPGAQINGTVSGEQVPDVAQVLVQWRTDTVVAGRFLRGRTFLPGCSSAYLSNGNLVASAQSAIATAANNFVAAYPGLVVWSRAHGTLANVDAASVWGEFATQRGRRG